MASYSGTLYVTASEGTIDYGNCACPQANPAPAASPFRSLPAALRTTMVGWQMITGAVFSILAQILIAALIGPLRGLTNVIKNFALLGIPSAVIFGLFIDETRGLPLEVAAREDEWADLHKTQLPDRSSHATSATLS